MGGGLNEGQLYDLAYNVVEPEIEHVPNVASARVGGGKIREICVRFDRERLRAFNLSPESVIQAVQQANLIIPSGDIKAGPYDYRLFTETQFSLVKPIENIIVTNVQKRPVYIRDIGEVIDDFRDQTDIIRVNGQPAVSLAVQKTSGTNTIEVVDGVRKVLPKIQKMLPPGVVMLELFDQSTYIRNSITNLQHEALMGAALAVLVILVFLRNLRSTLIVSLSIPISIVCAFILLYFSNLSLNMFTLGGLALGVGRLVDDAIVVLENIYRHRNAGASPAEASIQGFGRSGTGGSRFDHHHDRGLFARGLHHRHCQAPFHAAGPDRGLLPDRLVFRLAYGHPGSLPQIPASRDRGCLYPTLPTFLERMKWRFKGWFERIDTGYQTTLAWVLAHRKTVVLVVVGAFPGQPSALFLHRQRVLSLHG